ncbi:DUF4902 domain-containing protein [Trinickia dabaoshanensis]|uniref:DUF4902 domain-containing protein n=1 Tax=Trinickia dabaoshanensis TaxID=564714 RepID=A0A2N7W1P5_9BURK|nr:DUF4902 domain-containing protein [Trinickia dabaoshanensis]PMS23302.1 DUF4902 domain-containing protein [Trinickia dabaoshanensis]
MKRTMLTQQGDGYVRLTLPAFCALRFHQLMCLWDSDLLADFWDAGIPAVNAGYYELVCDDVQPVVSVGCAWYVTAGQGDIRIGPADVNTNVMLLDTRGIDYGAQCSREAVQDWLSSGIRRDALEAAVNREVELRRASV